LELTGFIPYGRQSIEQDDVKAVVEVLRSDFLTQGPRIKEFEDAICRYTGAKYAVAVSSGTAALHIAALAAGIKKGDEVITSPITFAASANCVLYCGGKPVFADIQPDTININPEEIKKQITRKTKAIIPVHFAGYPCDLQEIRCIAERHNLVVIEDACHALGAEYKCNGKWFKVGSCKHSDMTVFSFHPVKHITTGEGGAITTNSKKLYEKLKALKNHGMYKGSVTAQKGPWYYEIRELGFNYRITDFQCALGITQLNKINGFLERRRDLADRYNRTFSDLSDFVGTPYYADKTKKHAWHLYVLRLKSKSLRQDKKRIFEKLRAQGIGVQVHYIPVFYHPYYKKTLRCSAGDFPNSIRYYKEAMSIPLYECLSNTEQEKVIEVIKAVLKDSHK
jgi:UDP-4-amino-4,6-dideoxy-N-acetyl-beta-L-altrosamine transaminase